MAITAIVTKWGNGNGIHIPNEILHKASIELNDTLSFEVENDGCIVLTKYPAPQKRTLEYLLKSVPETIILSEKSLAEHWDMPEEDEAWADL